MFNSNKKKAERDIRRMLTASGLIKAAIADDRDAFEWILFGGGATDDEIWYALQTFLMVSYSHPEVIEDLKQARTQIPPKADMAFATAIEAATAGKPGLFSGGNPTGQALLIITYAKIISEYPEVMAEIMASYVPDSK